MCEHLFMHECVGFFLCVYALVCVHAPARESRLNLIYSPWGHLLTESNPPDRAQTEWKLNKITVIYSSGNGNLSGDSGAADLCPAIQIRAEMASILHTASLHRETPDALQLQRINQSAPSTPISAPAACQDSDPPSEDWAWGCTV